MSRSLITILVCGVFVNFTMAATLLDSNYQISTVASYSGNTGRLASVTFDKNGNFYLAHNDSGLIYKVTTGGSTGVWASGFDHPGFMQWGTGTAYGDYLYVANTGTDEVLKVDHNGNKQYFTHVGYTPGGLAIDTAGNYGGMMYVGTDVLDKVYKVSTTGVVSVFSNYPYNQSGNTCNMAFDPGTEYGGKMYIATISTVDPQYAGIFSLSATGAPTRFSNDLGLAWKIDFGPSDFDNNLFASAMVTPAQDRWCIYRLDSQGHATEFFRGGNTTFSFYGDDMYIADFTSFTNTTTVYKVSLIPEPVTILVLGLGAGAVLRSRKALRLR